MLILSIMSKAFKSIFWGFGINGGFVWQVSGGVLVIIALICMLLISSKVSDVVMEKKLAGDE
jgi:hypothetical protein